MTYHFCCVGCRTTFENDPAAYVDMLTLDVRTPEHEFLAATLATLRKQDAVTDRERVDAGEWVAVMMR